MKLTPQLLLLLEVSIVIVGIIVGLWWMQDYQNCTDLLNAGMKSGCMNDLLNLRLVKFLSFIMVVVFFVVTFLKTSLFGKRKRR